MAVRKYRSVEEMPDTGSINPRDPRLGQVIEALWDVSTRFALRAPTRGIRKYRSIEELNLDRQKWPVKKRDIEKPGGHGNPVPEPVGETGA